MTVTRASYNYNLYEQYFAITESLAEYTGEYFWYTERKVSVCLVPVLKNAGIIWELLSSYSSSPTPTKDAQHFEDSVYNENLVLENVPYTAPL